MSESFAVRSYVAGAARVVAPAGELDLATSPELDRRLQRALSTAPAELVLDLRGLDFMGSVGLRVILSAYTVCEEIGCRFAIVPGTTGIQRLFAITDLLDMFTFVEAPPSAPHQPEPQASTEVAGA